MDAAARDEIEALAGEVEPPCGFVLHGYGDPRPCRLSSHPRGSVHDCGGVLVAT